MVEYDLTVIRYTQTQLITSSFETREMIKKTIESLSKIDDELFGNIRGDGMQSHWVTKDLSTLCEKTHYPINNTFRKCQMGMKMKDGRYSEASEEECHGLPASIDQIDLFRHIKQI